MSQLIWLRQLLRFTGSSARWISGLAFGLILAGCARTEPPPSEPQLRLVGQHAGRVLTASFSPDGKRLASGGDDRTVRIWDLSTASGLVSLEGHAQRVESVVFSPDGQLLASQSSDLTVKLWDTSSWALKQTIAGASGNQSGLVFSPDSKVLAVISATPLGSGEIWLWDLSEPKLFRKLSHRSVITSFGMDRNGAQVVAGSRESIPSGDESQARGELIVWDLASGESRWQKTAHEHSEVRQIFFPKGELTVASLGLSQASHPTNRVSEIKIWDLKTGELKGSRQSYSARGPIAYSPANNTLAIFETPEGVWTVHLDQMPAGMDSRPLSPPAGATGKPYLERYATDWDLKDGTAKTWVASLAYSNDAHWLAGTCLDGCIRVWQIGESQ